MKGRGSGKGKGRARGTGSVGVKKSQLWPDGIPEIKSMSTGRARAVNGSSRAREGSATTSRSRTTTPSLDRVDVDVNSVEDVFMAPAAPRDHDREKGSGKNVFMLAPLAVRSGSDAEDEEEDEDEDLPDPAMVLAESHAKWEAEEKARQLREAKLAYLQRQLEDNLRARSDEEEGEELEVVADDAREVAIKEGKERRVMRASGVRESVGRRRQLQYARVPMKPGVSPGKPRAGGSKMELGDEDEDGDDGVNGLQILAAAAGPRHLKSMMSPTRPDVRAQRHSRTKLAPNELNRMLLNASNKQRRAVALKKEKMFYKRDEVELPTEVWRRQVREEGEDEGLEGTTGSA